MKCFHLIAGFAVGMIISQSLYAQKASDSSPEQIAARLAEWTQSGAMDKLVEVYHPDDLAAYQATLLEMTERLKAYGEPAPFAQAGMTPEQAKAMPAKEFMNRILHAASAGINEKLKEFKITVTAKVTEKTESAAQVTVRTQAQLTEAQKESLGSTMAAMAGMPNENTYLMKRDGDRWYVLFDDRMKQYGQRVTAAVEEFENRAAKDKGRTAPKGPLEPYEISGYKDEQGRTVIEPRFSSAKDFLDGRAAVEVDSKWGYVDATGRMVIEPRYADAEDFSDGLAAVQADDGTWGLIDKDGRIVLKPQYKKLDNYSEGLIAALKDDRWGFIDAAGKVIIPFQFAEADEFLEGTAEVKKTEDDEEGVLIDRTGKVVGKVNFEERLAAAMRKAEAAEQKRKSEAAGRGADSPAPAQELDCFKITGYRTKDGRKVIEPRFADGRDFSEGMAPVRFFGRWGYIDATGRTVINPAFTDARSFQSKRAAVEVEDEHWGFIDASGRFAIKPVYEDANDFSDGLAAVEKDGLWGYITVSGTPQIPHRYKEAGDFEDGRAVVTTEDDEEIVIDRSGKQVSEREDESDSDGPKDQQ